MTQEKQKAMRSFLTEEIQKWAVRMVLFAIVAVLVWLFTPLKDKVRGIWDSPEKLERIEHQLDALSALITNMSGENRVIRQTPGQSYVKEPVSIGEPVTLNLVAQRTALGEGCKLVESQSLFTDASGVAVPGRGFGVRRQITTDPTRLRVMIEPPASLIPGRIELYLALEYECSGKTVFDRTDTVYYTLLEVKP